MDMGIGASEVLLILAIILVFFGSKELPRFIREIARLIAKARAYSDKVRREIGGLTSDSGTPAVPPEEERVAVKKSELRAHYIAARASLDPAERQEKSAAICGHLMSTVEFKRAGAVMIYVAMGGEVETRPVIGEMARAGKRVLIPYCKKPGPDMGIGEIRDPETDVVIGEYKTPEPRPELRDRFFRSDLGLIVCPGVGFDSFGGRLGRGHACYDTFLRELKGKVPIMGLAFDYQVQTEQLPFSYSDVPMDQIITESGLKLPQSVEPEAVGEFSRGLAG